MHFPRLNLMSFRGAALLSLLAGATNPCWASGKGPDAGGYTATDAAVYSFVDISGPGGGASILAGIDDGAAPLTLPFSFQFYGHVRTLLCVSTNGAVYFIANASDCSHFNDFANLDLTSTSPPDDRPAAFPFWSDLTFDVPGAGAVIYQALGAAGTRRFVVQWNNAYPQGSPNPVTFQLILFEASNKILFQYRKVALGPGNPASNGAQATIGIRNAGALGNNQQIEWSFDAPVISDETALSFSGDSTAPVTSAAVNGPAGNAGWYRGAVQVTLTASDAGGPIAATVYSLDGGGVVSYSGPFAVSGDGVHQLSFFSTDSSGNQELPRALEIKIDGSAPKVQLDRPVDGMRYDLDEIVLAQFTCSDSVSGVSACIGTNAVGQAIDTRAGGEHSFTVTAQDVAGNTTAVAARYTVRAPGRMLGGGEVEADRLEHHFVFEVLERPNGTERGRLHYWTDDDDRKRREDRFESIAITSVVFADAPGFQPSRHNEPLVDSVVFSGRGTWNGAGGYAFEARATDQGEPGRGRDTMAVTVKDAAGHVVASFAGTLSSGNIQSKRLKR